MPDSKISGLTSATTPLAGTEVLPIVQGGQTRQVSVANLTAGRSVDASTLTVTGNTYLATTSGNVGVGTTTTTGRMSIDTGDGVVCFRNYNAAIGAGTGSAVDFLDASRSSIVDGGIRATNLTLFGFGATPLTFFTNNTERMRITSAGDVGIGTSSPSYKLDVVAAGTVTARVQNTTTSADAYFQAQNTVATGLFGVNATGQYMYTAQSVPTLFYNAGSERMRIDSAGNVGIGTSSPSGFGNTGKLAVQTASSTNGIVATFANSGATGAAIQLFQTGVDVATIGMPANSGGITFAPSGTTERMRLDSAGNLGLGVVPSAWGSLFKSLDIGTASGFSCGAVDQPIVGYNFYNNNANNIYKTTAFASKYEQASGQHQWYTAPSGTAGNAISFTQAMTLDASGDLLVGATSQAGVNSRGYFRQSADSDWRGVSVVSAASDQFVGGLYIDSSGNFTIAQSYLGTSSYKDIVFRAGGSERARITSGGDLLVGTTTAFAKLAVNGSIYATSGNDIQVGNLNNTNAASINSDSNDTSAALVFKTASAGLARTERMRITSAGKVGIGTSSPSTKFEIYAGHPDTTARLYSTGDGSTQDASLDMWASEPGWTYYGSGIGGNVNGHPYYGRRNTLFGQSLIRFVDGNTYFHNSATNVSSTPQMTLDASGNLGVGTTSPATYGKLAVESGANAIVARSGSSTFCEISVQSGSADAVKGQFQAIEGSTNKVIIGARTNHPLAFNINDTERARIDSSGNLGLGVTPSAWATYKATQVGWSAFAGYAAADTAVFSNAFFDGGYKYIGNGFASQYRQINSAHQWFTAPSGTAGNAISFTQAMTLDASGNLLVGTTTANAKAKIALTGSATTPIVNVDSFGSAGVFSLGGIANNNEQIYFGMGDAANSHIAAGFGFLREGFGWNSALAFYTNNVTAGPNGVGAITERMRLDSAGNLGLGVVPSAWGSGFVALDIDAVTSLACEQDVTTVLGQNCYNNGGWKYRVTNIFGVSRYDQFNGAHIWHTAPSGTAGNTISFTQAMTLDANGNLGVGTTSPDIFGRFYTRSIGFSSSGTTALQINGTAYGTIDLGAGGTRTTSLTGSGTEAQFATVTSIPLIFGTNTTERMRITAAGDVGIGTSSPAAKFEVANTSGNVAAILRSSNSGYSELYFADVADNAASAISYEHATNILRLYNGGSARVYLDASGNLGLGVTPSAWSGITALEFGGGNFIASNGGNGVWQGNNCYYNGANWIYKATAAASYSNQVLGAHAWFNAPSGTAGNVISFTQAMTLDASGRLLIGTTTAGIGNNNATALSVANGTATVYQSIRASGGEELYLYSAAGSVGLYSYTNHPLVFGTNNAERMRLDASGNLGLGTSSPLVRLHVAAPSAGTITTYLANFAGGDANFRLTAVNGNGTTNASGEEVARFGISYAGDATTLFSSGFGFLRGGGASDGQLLFYTNATERMRLDASGNLGVGTSSPQGKLSVANGTIFVGSESNTTQTNNLLNGYGYRIGSTLYGNTSIRSSYSNTSNSAGLEFYVASSGTTTTEAMRIDASGNLLVGTTSTSALTAFSGSAVGQVIQSGVPVLALVDSDDTTNGVVWLANSSGVGYLYTKAANPFVFGTNSVEKMRLDSTGRLLVGVTTTGPQLPSGSIQYATTSHIASGGFGRFWVPSQQIGSATYAGLYGLATTYNAYYSGGWKSLGGGTAGAITIDEGIFAFSNTNSVGAADQPLTWTNRLVIDNSGNLGLGVTPSAWGSAIKAIQMGFAGSTAISGRTDAFQSNFTLNAYDTGSNTWVYLQSTTANRYSMVSGQHQWFTAPSGTAGNAISFTQAMTLDASGNLLVGKTSPTYSASNRNVFEINGTDSSIVAMQYGGANGAYFQLNSTAWYAWNSGNTPMVFATNNTERARITSTGNIHTPAGSTSMTDGFIYIPSAGGTPTGAATAITGTVPLYYDTTNNKLFIYNSSWQNIATAGSLPLVSTNANGVVYLNSSSQATTSTALQFNGTELGIGQAASAGIQVDVATTALAQIRARATTNGVDSRLAANSSGLLGYVGTISNHDFAFYTNNTERARITAAGVLQLSPVGGEGGELNLLNPTGGTIGGVIDVSTANNFRLWTGNLNATMQIGQLSSTGGNIQFYTEATERMRITSAGVVGIGTSSPGGVGVHVQNNTGGALYYASGTVAAGGVTYLAYNASSAAGSTSTFTLWNDNGFSTSSANISFYSSGSTIPNELRISQGANAPMTFYTNNTERLRITNGGSIIATQQAHASVNTSATLDITDVRIGIVVCAPTVDITITLPTGTTLESYSANMPVGASFELTIILDTTNGGDDITIAANGNTFYPPTGTNVTTNGPATLRFRKTATNTFSVYRIA